jgi:hypothetical protein
LLHQSWTEETEFAGHGPHRRPTRKASSRRRGYEKREALKKGLDEVDRVTAAGRWRSPR